MHAHATGVLGSLAFPMADLKAWMCRALLTTALVLVGTDVALVGAVAILG